MFTLFIIILIVAACVASKKKKHNTEADESARCEYPSFEVKARPMSTFSKVVNLAFEKSELIDTISYHQGWVVIRMQNGKVLKGELSSLFVDFDKVNGVFIYKVKSAKTKVEFYRTTNITDEEWKLIDGMLMLAGTTCGEYVHGETYKNNGRVNTAVNIISKL